VLDGVNRSGDTFAMRIAVPDERQYQQTGVDAIVARTARIAAPSWGPALLLDEGSDPSGGPTPAIHVP
jgi:hypothetical protein